MVRGQGAPPSAGGDSDATTDTTDTTEKAMESRRGSQAVLTAGIYWGAVWGLYEATVGWLVHFLPRVPGTASVVLVPFGVFCLDRALRGGGGPLRAALVAAATAATLKLADLALPMRTLQSVLNPAVAILLQGLAFVVVARALGLARRLPSLRGAALGALAFSAGWRLAFLLYSAVLARGWSLGMLRDGLHTSWGFLVRDGLLGAAAVLLVMALAHRRGRTIAAAPRPAPAWSAVVVLFFLALAAEVAVGLAW